MSQEPPATPTLSPKDEAHAKLAARNFRLGVYKHFKGFHVIVYSLSIDEGTLEPLVHYGTMKSAKRLTRTLENFEEHVAWPNEEKTRSRFVFIRDATLTEVLFVLGMHALVKHLQHLGASQRALSVLADPSVTAMSMLED